MQYILTEEEYKNLVPKEKYEEMKKKAYDLDDKLLELKIQQQSTSEKKEFKIGETFQFGLIKLKVVKSTKWNSCEGCYMTNLPGQCKSYYDLIGKCLRGEREDKTDILFVKVEDDVCKHT